MVEDDPVSVVVLPSTPTAPASSSHVPTSNNVPVSYDITAYNSTPPALDEEELQMEEWGDWNTTSSQPPQTTVYSSRAPEAKELTPDPDIDFFKDMEPTVKVKKVLVRKKSSSVSTSNRLAMNQDLEFEVSKELDEWRDEEGWSGEDGDQFDIDEAEIRREAQQQRKLERQQRVQQHKYHKTSKSHLDKLGLKVS